MSNAARFNSAIQAYDFMMAGNATITLVSTKTGQRYTFKIRQPEDKFKQDGQPDLRKGPAGMFFVSLLTGPENTTDYTYLGMVLHNEFKLTKASKMSFESAPVRAFQWVFNWLVTKHEIPEAVEIWHEGRCGRCGRPLTVPESIAAGIGPECARKAA